MSQKYKYAITSAVFIISELRRAGTAGCVGLAALDKLYKLHVPVAVSVLAMLAVRL